jgi:hypothetical protein
VRTKRTLLAVTAAVAIAGALAAAVAAGTGGQLRIEKGWYEGHEVTFLQPSLFSHDTNGGTLACFGLGPDLTGIDRPAQPLYVIFDPTAIEDHCDGDPTMLRHEHILPVAPGDPGYTGAWRLVLLFEATPGSIDLASHPFTNADDVQKAIANGMLVNMTEAIEGDAFPVEMIAPVIGGN